MNTFDFDRIVRDPAIFAEGRLPAHSDHVAYRTANEVHTGKSSLHMPLDGLWRFHYARNLASAPKDFPDVDSSGWDTIRVPAHVQMEGWGVPAYNNYQYPWDGTEDLKPGEVPTYFNPVMDYVTSFTLPESYEGMKRLLESEAALQSGSTEHTSATARTASHRPTLR